MILLDTHVLLWLLSNRLSTGARDRILRAGRVYFSSVSITEIMIKSLIGKLSVPTDFAERLPSFGLVELPYTTRHATELLEFPDLSRHDPFDRMLLAQAKAEGIEFLTSDARLVGLPGVLDAR